MNLLPDLIGRLACPRCKFALRIDAEAVICADPACGRTYPIINGVPILIVDERSAFSVEEFATGASTTFDWDRLTSRSSGGIAMRLAHFVADHSPSLSLLVAEFTLENAIAEICMQIPAARILMVGCGDQRYAVPSPAIAVYTDVSRGPITQIVCDGHDIPFKDETFDAVVTIAVLCCVCDPYRCVAEMRRVLKPQGFVYDAMPFMQQVFLGRYDFTRFTALGHRRLFRGFSEIRRGMANGPAMALAWSISYFLLSFSESPSIRKVVRLAARYLFFWIKYFDRILYRKLGAYDAASGFYFFGCKSAVELSDKEVLKSHRGLNPQ